MRGGGAQKAAQSDLRALAQAASASRKRKHKRRPRSSNLGVAKYRPWGEGGGKAAEAREASCRGTKW